MKLDDLLKNLRVEKRGSDYLLVADIDEEVYRGARREIAERVMEKLAGMVAQEVFEKLKERIDRDAVEGMGGSET